MSAPIHILLYVADPMASAGFYERLLGRPPVEAHPTFVGFSLDTGIMLGLWLKANVVPAATAPGGCEVAFEVDGIPALEEKYDAWRGAGVTIIQELSDMDFGRMFTAVDPDGHRLRVFYPRQPA